MDGRERKDVRPGFSVAIVLKQDQRTGRLTRGVVKDVLTKSSFHPHGIKVRLETGEVGRLFALRPAAAALAGTELLCPTRRC
jgi:uncharacterized repeat protein (TIGR03833 family)